MKHPGRPETPPSWYRDRGQSYIERQFSANLEELANAIEREHWFGDAEKHSRYRVDFLLRDARLVIELDGHEHHSTKEQLESDAIRQRYLSRAGYTVVRFTGREIVRDVSACVSEVRAMYRERMQRSPLKYRVVYVDYPFFAREMANALRFYRGQHPEKSLKMDGIAEFLPHAIDSLHEKSFITAFIFHPLEDSAKLAPLDGSTRDFDRGEIRINLNADPLYSIALGEHLQSFAHFFDQFLLVADDHVYVEPMRFVLPAHAVEAKLGALSHKSLPNGKLLRKGNDETAFAGTDLAIVPWQDIWYALGASMGLSPREL